MAGIQEAFRKAALAAMKGAGNTKEEVQSLMNMLITLWK
jgi:hypothetical protein